MKIKSRYAIPSNVAYHFKSDMPSLTSQKFKDRVALDRIVDMSSGELVIKDQQAFLDLYDEDKLLHSFSENNNLLFDATVGNDFTSLSTMYANAKSEFEGLPSEVRRLYHDNVDEFLDKVVVYNQNAKTQSVTPPPAEKSAEAPSDSTSAGDGEKSV